MVGQLDNSERVQVVQIFGRSIPTQKNILVSIKIGFYLNTGRIHDRFTIDVRNITIFNSLRYDFAEFVFSWTNNFAVPKFLTDGCIFHCEAKLQCFVNNFCDMVKQFQNMLLGRVGISAVVIQLL